MLVITGIDVSRGLGHKELVVQILPDGFAVDWQETAGDVDVAQVSTQEDLYSKFHEDRYRALFMLGFSNLPRTMPDSIRFLGLVSAAFVMMLSRTSNLEVLRDKVVIDPDEVEIKRLLQIAPYMHGAEYLSAAWMARVWSGLNDAFSTEISAYQGTVSEFFNSHNPAIHLVGRVFFHLVENKEGDYPFAFLATYASGAAMGGKSKHLPLKNALVEYKDDKKKLLDLLSTVNQASAKSRFIAELVESGEIFHPIGMMSQEAYTFLKEIPFYEEAGVLCRIPNWWKSKSNSLKISITVGNQEPSRLGFDAIVDWSATLSMGGESVTVDELRDLLSEAEGLAFIKGKWVEVNHEKLKETLRAYEQAQKLIQHTDMTMTEAMRLQLNPAKVMNIPTEACELEITNGEWMEEALSRLTHPREMASVSSGRDFHASLRPYQQKGLAWLLSMKSLGFGACLADDMGLGKTVQVIALLNYIRCQTSEKTLLIVPASLIGNWTDEITKFAPALKYYVLHPSENKTAIHGDTNSVGKGLEETLQGYDLCITTYGILQKSDWLREIRWDTLILDEAQAIKNPGTKQTRAVKQIKAKYKIAMTGTPIENRLSELWSLFDFLNKGLLGSSKEFTDFTKLLKENQAGYARIKTVVSPFILRRLKTDKSVITDLPDKIEMKTYTTLTKRQAALYNALVEEIQQKLASSEPGIERKGLILSSLMKFKQICNHPEQYLGGAVFTESESGKFARLRELCESIYEKRERVLVFTQFKELTDPISEFLETVFQHRGLVLHGGTAVSRRKELVDKFQGNEYVPFMVLSIKAGGVGLNLTAANHVIHFDRWWNPAVENQATDRAFRIGQRKNVIVHKFITRGTIEEKIDMLIEDKTKLSKEIISDMQENWVTEMDNAELMDLFRLSI
jgi:SNF2 family DNA or RNA helicase